MKKIIILFLSVLLLGTLKNATAQDNTPVRPEAPYLTNKNIPAFNLLLADGKNFTQNNIPTIKVRKIWYLISKTDTDIEEISNPESLQLLVNELVVNMEDKYIETFSGENSRVPELIKYKWFLNYYR